MNALRIYAVGVLVSATLVAVIFAPLFGLPIGATPSTGGSMGDTGPTLNIYTTGEPEIGDVVIYETDNWGTHDHAVHRVVGAAEDGYKTQGDANQFVDQERGAPHATSENTVGVVVARVTVLETAAGGMFGLVAIGTYSLTGRSRPRFGVAKRKQ